MSFSKIYLLYSYNVLFKYLESLYMFLWLLLQAIRFCGYYYRLYVFVAIITGYMILWLLLQAINSCFRLSRRVLCFCVLVFISTYFIRAQNEILRNRKILLQQSLKLENPAFKISFPSLVFFLSKLKHQSLLGKMQLPKTGQDFSLIF